MFHSTSQRKSELCLCSKWPVPLLLQHTRRAVGLNYSSIPYTRVWTAKNRGDKVSSSPDSGSYRPSLRRGLRDEAVIHIVLRLTYLSPTDRTTRSWGSTFSKDQNVWDSGSVIHSIKLIIFSSLVKTFWCLNSKHVYILIYKPNICFESRSLRFGVLFGLEIYFLLFWVFWERYPRYVLSLGLNKLCVICDMIYWRLSPPRSSQNLP